METGGPDLTLAIGVLVGFVVGYIMGQVRRRCS